MAKNPAKRVLNLGLTKSPVMATLPVLALGLPNILLAQPSAILVVIIVASPRIFPLAFHHLLLNTSADFILSFFGEHKLCNRMATRASKRSPLE